MARKSRGTYQSLAGIARMPYPGASTTRSTPTAIITTTVKPKLTRDNLTHYLAQLGQTPGPGAITPLSGPDFDEPSSTIAECGEATTGCSDFSAAARTRVELLFNSTDHQRTRGNSSTRSVNEEHEDGTENEDEDDKKGQVKNVDLGSDSDSDSDSAGSCLYRPLDLEVELDVELEGLTTTTPPPPTAMTPPPPPLTIENIPPLELPPLPHANTQSHSQSQRPPQSNLDLLLLHDEHPKSKTRDMNITTKNNEEPSQPQKKKGKNNKKQVVVVANSSCP
ncbi:hypothetical protein QBC32DRAFT_345812 [Pseudoneurospora amorphoporcata]|uniref:Uncharacterized protein n=1 Tax=Pseudoneurospora amorphoporcata TaxID=241081 RepID=A0AAN6NTA2_9PEZI|nr:hypothetical protein QBC32DRAFT_345812 [Pseudoneurospora amorphoporcata]